ELGHDHHLRCDLCGVQVWVIFALCQGGWPLRAVLCVLGYGRQMTPRALTFGSIRHFPGEPPPERRTHGPITNLVRKDRCGCVAYEGTCDGEPICIVELRPGLWRATKRDGVPREGTLEDVAPDLAALLLSDAKGILAGAEWRRTQ
ncbi:MAG TPA: hypothetical protein VFB99_24430, partial [Vicinamibacterales bacterium]|nr:hypothetical protein [Vicinamibacterales bacterium]